jgi:hypothetical protein
MEQSVAANVAAVTGNYAPAAEAAKKTHSDDLDAVIA